MVERGEHGKLKPGSVLNPKGRGKRTDEEKFNAVLLSVVSPERFRTALEKQVAKMERGDLEAFKYVCKLLGLEVQKSELSGANGSPLQTIIEYINTPYPAADVPSGSGGDIPQPE